MYNATLSIDLGASYTKIAYRDDCTPPKVGAREKNAHVLTLARPAPYGPSPLIPSLAIKGKKGQWSFGSTAAGMTPGEHSKVFSNWKANLFRPTNDDESVTATIVAEQFFRWLRDEIEKAGIALDKTEVRVAVPAFKNIGDQTHLIARCMDMAGWDCLKILKSTEPHANAIGLFTRGQNCLSRNPQNEILLNYGRMFGLQSGYIGRAREFVLRNPRRDTSYRVMIVDVGAFTTDVACLVFDVNSEHDGLTKVEQDSYEVGVINQLDRPLFACLEQRHGFSSNDISFTQMEQIKADLYPGGSHTLVARGKGHFEIGGSPDRDLVEKHTEAFAKKIWKDVSPHVSRNKPDEVLFTGGGVLIPAVRQFLANELSEQRIRVPRNSADSERHGTARWRLWQHTGEHLMRLGTAVGGVSVVLQAPSAKNGQKPARVIKIPEPIDDYHSCRCQGGNKDCFHCDGRGYYRKRI